MAWWPLWLAAALGCGRSAVFDCTLSIAPAALDFGGVGGTATEQIQIQSVGSDSCGIWGLGLDGGGAGFSLPAGQATSITITPGQTATVNVAFQATSAAPSQRQSALVFQTTSLAMPQVSIPLSATVPSCLLQLSPTSVDFGTATLGTAATAQVTLTSRGQFACLVSQVAISPSSDPGFSVPARQPVGFLVSPGDQATVAVDFEADQSTSPFTRRGTLTFATTDLDAPQLTVALSALVPSCSLAVSPLALDFGQVTIDGSATQSVTVDNAGTLTCAVSAIALANGTDADFSLPFGQPSSLSIPAGSTQSISVEFADVSGDSPPLLRQGTLGFVSSDPAQPAVSVPLSAQVICTADSQCPVGQICALSGGTLGTCGSNVGCADGTREGFLDTTAYPRISGCSGGFSIASLPTAPQCGNASGNSGNNPNGTGCAASDLCAPNFHVCFSSADVASNSSTGCTGSAPSTGLFFACLQSGPGCGLCGGAQGQSACSFPVTCNGCQSFGSCANDLFGCGSLGSTPDSSCGVLNAFSNNLCGALGAPWSCPNVNNGCAEFATVTKSGPAGGGVLCCGN